MYLRKLSTIFLLILLTHCADAQLHNIWYFGQQAGLNFNPSSGQIPTVLNDHAMIADEGCASICDSDGNILFYTNGRKIYNKSHVVMDNGDGLLGHNSSFQAAQIVPMPNSDSIYYVFTSDAYENDFQNGYRYHIVDMSLNNGLGRVITKNVLLSAPSTERLIAARHANGIDVWVITNDLESNVFRAWQVSCTGISPTPVVSTVGELLNTHDYAGLGAMKVSPDGKQLCQTHFPETDGLITNNFFQVFDFDNNTGRLTNPRKISMPNTYYYACEFSPDSRFLYVSKIFETTIDQYEAYHPDAASIAASKVSIPAMQGIWGMQIGPDKKIYATRSTQFLSVIEEPNVKGIGANFVGDKINLLGRYASLNLPAAINDQYSVIDGFTFSVVDACNAIVQFNGSTSISGPVIWEWDFGDGTTSSLQNPSHTFPEANLLYTVTLKIRSPGACGFVERSEKVSPGGVIADARFTATTVCDSGYVRFTNESIYFPANAVQFLWTFGDNTSSNDFAPLHVYPSSGIYTVKLKLITQNGCLDDSLSTTIFLEQMDIQATPDQTIDMGQSIQLDVTGGGDFFSWDPPVYLNNSNIKNPVAKPIDDIVYVVTATNASGCVDTDTVRIKVIPIEGVFVPTAFTPNGDGKNDVLKPLMGPQYTLLDFSVYNRWGQLVFTTKQIGAGWDGKIGGAVQMTNAFVWKVSVKDRQGNVTERSGTTTLIR